MSTFLERWFDPALSTPNALLVDEIEEHHRTRLAEQGAMAFYAQEVPRRLSDATPAELAEDKKTCRKVRARSLTMLRTWGGTDADMEEAIQHATPELKRQGNQVIWANWWADHKAKLQACLTEYATTAIKTGELKAGNRFCNRILNELNTLGQIFEPEALYR